MESLVAMTIILLTVTLSAMLYSGISSQRTGLKSVLLQDECMRLFNEYEKNHEAMRSASTESFLFTLKAEPYMNRRELTQVNIVVREKATEKKIFEFNRLTRTK